MSELAIISKARARYSATPTSQPTSHRVAGNQSVMTARIRLTAIPTLAEENNRGRVRTTRTGKGGRDTRSRSVSMAGGAYVTGPSAFSMAWRTSAASGAVGGSNRATTAPDRSTMNLAKFQLMSPGPSGRVGWLVSHWYTGARRAPLTSILANMGNVTP